MTRVMWELYVTIQGYSIQPIRILKFNDPLKLIKILFENLFRATKNSKKPAAVSLFLS